MGTIGVFIDNYKETTKGFNFFAKVLVAFVLSVILAGVVTAIFNMIVGV